MQESATDFCKVFVGWFGLFDEVRDADNLYRSYRISIVVCLSNSRRCAVADDGAQRIASNGRLFIRRR